MFDIWAAVCVVIFSACVVYVFGMAGEETAHSKKDD